MNGFVNNVTEGMIKEVVDAKSISSVTLAMFINAVYFHGDWQYTFSKTYNSTFHGSAGDRQIEFMRRETEFRVNTDNAFGTALLLPYKDESYRFFIMMPNQKYNMTQLRDSLTGKALLDVLNSTENTDVTVRIDQVIVPKFRVDSNMDAVGVLKKLGVSTLFGSGADLSKISSDPMSVSSIKHVAVIEVSELGTTAAAATVVGFTALAMPSRPPLTITIDHPFIYGIMKNDDILFIGQFV
ncbi:hypothetical protein PENTCL1PPCAC_14315 [Pristionchus entomophagus]|uniref:Serpin domain-containing protein n=1 Tax=Pristionchus entomophagus TaxID=358040 RepID=A0AAV5TAH3_9BILA|nr:hypothetical protein PENTCL1PPCAC_14315 [Pristionchus entomophagus]